ncbi:hypothetical protein ACB092_06G245600 [Castanea dentata]
MTGRKIASIPALLLFLLILLILLIFFSLSLSVSKQHNPFLSYEFIVVKNSSRVAVFFVFNVIVITIFRGNLSLKPSDGDFDYFLSFPPIVYEFDDDTKDEAKYEDYGDSDVDDSDKYHGDDDGYDEDDDDDGEGSDDEQVEDLETKIEDFIAKGHKQGREELMHDQKFHCMAATELQ